MSISKEFDNFGFLTGKMVKVKDVPEMKDVLDWAWEERSPIEELLIIDHPGRGRYYAIDDGEDILPIHQMRMVDETLMYASEGDKDQAKHDAERFTTRRATFYEFFAEDAWGKAVKMAEIDAMFKESEFFAATSQTGAPNLWEKSTKHHNETIAKAIMDGILTQFKAPALHIEVVGVDWMNRLRLLNYPFKDVAQLAADMSAINAAADNTAEEARRQGKIKF